MKQMKKILLFLLSALAFVSCGDSNVMYVKQAVRIMDRNGLFATGDDWEAAKAEALASQPSSLEEAQAVVKDAARVAGGKHSFLYKAEQVKEDRTSRWKMPEVEIGEGNIAIITLPGFMGDTDEGKKYAMTVLDAVPDDVRGAVIDLRGNTGGNMSPMISAVQRFIDDGENMLRFRGRKRTAWMTLPYIVKVTGVQAKERIVCPVAILTDSLTASSGEATLICFRGQENVRTFGGPTAGYASANSPFPLPDGSKLVLTTSCDVARTGEVFCDDPILPDELTDSPLEDALAWLSGRSAI